MNPTQKNAMTRLAVIALVLGLGACKTMHGIGEDTEAVGNKIQKEADQHTENDDNEDNREHDEQR